MIRICPQCRHHRAPVAIRPFGAGSGRSPGMIKAQREWLEETARRRAEEQRRVEARYDFDYEPEFHAWCAENVPVGDRLRRLQASLEGGDRDALDRALESGARFTVDPAKGRIMPIYDLCAIKNGQGDCKQFAGTDEGAGHERAVGRSRDDAS